MSLLQLLENGLFALGQILRFPVIALLWVTVVMTLYFVGASAVQAIRRSRDRARFDLKTWLMAGAALTATKERQAKLPTGLQHMLAAIQSDADAGLLRNGGLENIVAEREEALRHSLDGPRALVKVGPSLGLLGTLIPMGASLAAMANGDLKVMAAQMVVAFTTTIIGLATGTIAYALVALRQSWISVSVREQRYLAEVVAAELDNR